MKITVLCENTTEKNNIIAEHGLSLYIELPDHKILFDMGQTDAFAQNAINMGIDLREADLAVLSHGHYDHGGGLKTFIDINNSAYIYLSKYSFGDHYNGNNKFIGLDKVLLNSNRLVFIEDRIKLSDNITLYSCNNRKKILPTNPYGLSIMHNNILYPDDFKHEQYMLIEHNNNKILISGCSHKGIINILEWFKPDILIGGFHFTKLDPETNDKELLVEYAKKMLEYPTNYFTGHCTGTKQYYFLKTLMGNRLGYISSGSVLSL